MKPKSKPFTYWTGQFTEHDRYFKTRKGIFEFVSGWYGDGGMSYWKIDFVQVDDKLQRFSNEITYTANRMDLLKLIIV